MKIGWNIGCMIKNKKDKKYYSRECYGFVDQDSATLFKPGEVKHFVVSAVENEIKEKKHLGCKYKYKEEDFEVIPYVVFNNGYWNRYIDIKEKDEDKIKRIREIVKQRDKLEEELLEILNHLNL